MTRFCLLKKLVVAQKSFYGACNFLDIIEEFKSTFRKFPTMLPSLPKKTSTEMSCQKSVRDYGDQYKLEICMHLCRLNYVVYMKVDVGLNT